MEDNVVDMGPGRAKFDAECVRWVRVTAKILAMTQSQLDAGEHRQLLQAQGQHTVSNLKDPAFVLGNVMYAMEGLLEMFTSTLNTLHAQQLLHKERVIANYTAAFIGAVQPPAPAKKIIT